MNVVIEELSQELAYNFGKALTVKKCDSGFCIEKKGEKISVECSGNLMLSRALLELKLRLTSSQGDFKYEFKPHMDNMGIMFDVSRNGVLNMPTLKRLARICALLGYNMMLLYMEDIYPVEEQPYFGYLRGGYTVEELRELEAYAAQFGVELVPCIQTLAHLNAPKKWQDLEKYFDLNDILLCDSEPTYELIDQMFKAIRKCFSTKKINIGMDEAEMVGLGRHLKKFGYEERFPIILRHLNRVAEIAKKYGFEPVMWSDMFFKIVNDGFYYGENPVPREVMEKVPQNVGLAYWDYRSTDTAHYDRMLSEHKKFNRNIWMVNTSWKCIGFVPHNAFTFKTLNALIPAMRKHEVTNFYTTCWGDNGAECSVFGVLPSFVYTALRLNGIDGEESFEATFKALTDCDLKTFMLIETPNMLGDTKLTNECPSKYFLYNDPFCGFLDSRIHGDYVDSVKKWIGEIESCDCGKFQKVFDVSKTLLRALELKLDLGLVARKAYREGDTKKLKELKDVTCPELIKRLEAFHAALYARWNDENRPHGFEIHDSRIGGLIQRIKTCAKILGEHLESGKKIEELECDVLPFKCPAADDEHWGYSGWEHYFTVNTVTGA